MTGHSFLSGFASCPQRYGIIVSGIVIPHLSHHQYMYTLLAWGELLHFYYTTNIISVKLHLSYLTLDRGFEILTNFSRDSHIVEVSCTFPASYGLNCWIFYTTGCCCGGSTDPKTVTHVKFNQLDIGICSTKRGRVRGVAIWGRMDQMLFPELQGMQVVAATGQS